MKIFISGSFKDKDKFDILERKFKKSDPLNEIVRMDAYWNKQKDYDTTNFTKPDYWKIDLQFLSKCDCAVFLPDWASHDGCELEHEFCISNHIPVFMATNFTGDAKDEVYILPEETRC